jgi:hypothetical protein
MKNNQSELISGLSKRSKENGAKLGDNNPVIRKNKQLDAEVERLSCELESSQSENISLKKSLEDINDLKKDGSSSKDILIEKEKEISKALSVEIKRSKERNIELKNVIDKYQAQPDSKLNSSTLSITEFIDLNLTANAQKVYKGILKFCITDGFHQISGRKFKSEFGIHENYFASAKLELKEKGLIDFKGDYEGKRKIVLYKKLR